MRIVVLDDLPVSGNHEIFAGEQGLSVENADTPIELCRQVLLSKDEFRLFQQLPYRHRQRPFRGDFHHAHRECAIGLLQDARQAQRRHDVVHVVSMHQQGFRCREVMACQQFGQIHLVAAFEYRIRIVHHDQAGDGGLPCKLVSVVIDVGGIADEQRIELR